jgi:hypothetical protein
MSDLPYMALPLQDAEVGTTEFGRLHAAGKQSKGGGAPTGDFCHRRVLMACLTKMLRY